MQMTYSLQIVKQFPRKARKRSACRTLAPSAVAIATISSRASVHPPEGFLLYRNCVVIAQQVRDSTVNGNKQFPIKQKRHLPIRCLFGYILCIMDR